MNFRLFLESFDKVSDFFLNPEHRDKGIDELTREFEASGGKILGVGRHSTAYYHPSWPYVIKVFSDNACFLKFARYAYSHPHPNLPKFYGPPQKIVPWYTRAARNSVIYLTRTELLHKPNIPMSDLNIINAVLTPATPDDLMKQHHSWVEFFEKYPQAKGLFSAYKLVNDNVKECSPDLSPSNIMQRSDGTLVLNDPVWEGSNPYADALRAQRMETDWYDDRPRHEKLVRGGEKYKKPKPKKFIPVNYKPPKHLGDEIPF